MVLVGCLRYLADMLKGKFYTDCGDNELFCLVKQDDATAFTELYNRYWKKLFAIAYNRLKEIQYAEDIVHDVFAGLWARRHKLEIELLENYLATAAKYAVLTKIKKQHKEVLLQRNIQPVLATDFPAETSLHYKRILEIIKAEVEKLPEKCRLIFKCSRDEGKPVKQIARELNLSPKTVENQLTKALKRLKVATRSFLHSIILLLSSLFL